MVVWRHTKPRKKGSLVNDNTLDIEPGYSPPIFVKVVPKDGSAVDLQDAQMKLVIRLNDTLHEIAGIRDMERGGFSHNIDEWGAIITSTRTVKAFIYADFGTGWDQFGSISLKPKEGAYWQASR